ncbi:MAG: baseplate J/gp47 family protein [Thiotrichaceae bacterium]|nr:baseplate J/gp47 family protein [Thiotrichaceae bacterium]
MGSFDGIDLHKLPTPDIITVWDSAQRIAESIAQFRNLAPEYSAIVESDPVYKLIEQFEYQLITFIQLVNDAVKANMLATSMGADLDNLAAVFGVVRLEDEDDLRFRDRVPLSLESISTAGAEGSYAYLAASVSSEVKDVDIFSPSPSKVISDLLELITGFRANIFAKLESLGLSPSQLSALKNEITEQTPTEIQIAQIIPKLAQVTLTILAKTGSGVPPQDLINAVYAALSADEYRPLTDQVFVKPADIIEYKINAVLWFYGHSPDKEVVRKTALTRVA